MSGFHFAYRLSGGAPTIQSFTIADAAFAVGDLVNLESSEIDLAATNDTALVGGVVQSITGGTTSTDRVEVVTDDDAVYATDDSTARSAGDTLDISGATGAQAVAASTNADLVVVADSTAGQQTLVRIVPSSHYLESL